MSVTLRYFAWVREAIGVAEEQVPLDGPELLETFLQRLKARSPGHAAGLGEQARLRAAVNREHVGWDALVTPGDEVALFPPVTGG